MDAAGQLWTIGHSNREVEMLIAMLHEAGIHRVVDVRRFPGSRRWPQFSGEALAGRLVADGIQYQHLSALGGRRKPVPGSPNTAWRVDGFRAYADHLASAEYTDGRAQLIAMAREMPTAVMCAEALWWQCHRRLIADDLVARGWQVIHLMAPGKTQDHVLNADAVMMGDVLRYPAPQAELFDGSG